ncbi:MAG: TaqI-like C-terminal specificity domain-containing protein, partial [Candidatus Hydrothermia bacterium]
IEYSLYGVDIDPGACEIAKLRLWLSLVVDEDDIRQIKPLPNLDYKIVCGDSLISVEKNLFNAELFNQLESLKPLLFNETNPTKKQEYKKQIDELIYQITNNHNKFDFKIYFSEVFHEKGGFDIVIANPPYIQLQKDHGKLANIYKNYGFETFDRRGDIYTLFYEKGLQILNNSGHLTFISSNKWMRAGYGEKLRSFFLKYNPKILIDLGPNVFESATVDTNMLIIQKAKNQNQLKAVTITENKKDNLDFFRILKDNGVVLSNLTKDAWFIGNNAEQQLKEKIEHIGKPLKDWDVKIYRGIVTGLNEAFIIDSTKRQEILSNCKDEDERRRTEAIIKPLLRGRDIKRYYYEWAGLWVIGTFPALRLNINNYPAIKKYFLDYFDIRQLEQSGKQYPELSFNARKKTGNKWFETQDQIAYYHEFEKEKVIYSEIVREPQFHYDSEKFYIEATSFLMTGEYIKYICGLLNSKPVSFFFKQYYAGGGLGQEGYRYKKAFLEKLPLPPITSSNKPIVRQIEELVDKILAAKKQNPQADTNHWEREIDQLVYQLYELTDEEIAVVEAGG